MATIRVGAGWAGSDELWIEIESDGAGGVGGADAAGVTLEEAGAAVERALGAT